MITLIVAPEAAPQTFVPALHGVEHPLAMEVVTAMHQHGHRPVPLWKLIDGLAEARRPSGRDQRRCLCLRFWGAIRELLRSKVLFRHDGMVATKDFAFTPTPRSRSRLSPDVVRLASETTVSGSAWTKTTIAAHGKQIPKSQISSRNEAVQTGSAEVQSAPPSSADISRAASSLAKRPRTRKTWSGWIGSTRSYCGMPIRLLTTGESVFAFGALRKKVVWSRLPGNLGDTIDGAGLDWGVARARDVEVIRNQHAVALGRLKAGKVERKSEAKARSARLNGLGNRATRAAAQAGDDAAARPRPSWSGAPSI